MKIDLRKVPAVYMNLEQHTEKSEQMQNLLKGCGFETIIRVEGPYRPDNPSAGCAGAHYNGLCEIDPPFVLFEDDCLLHNFEPIIEVPDDADAVYLGTSQWARYFSFLDLLFITILLMMILYVFIICLEGILSCI